MAGAQNRKTTSNHVDRPKEERSVTSLASVTHAGTSDRSKHYTHAKLDFILEALNNSEREAPGSDVALANYFRALASPRSREDQRLLSRATPAQLESLEWKVAIANCFESVRRLMRALAPRPDDGKTIADRRRRVELTGEYFRGFADAILQIDNLRNCVICGRWFRPRRVDQKCCSKVCAGTLRVRRHRAQQAAYEYNRKLRSAGLKPGKGKT